MIFPFALPEYSLALEEVLQAHQALLPLGPVGAGAVVEDLGHVLRLPQVVGDGAVAGAVGALGAGAGGIAVGVVVRVHSRRLEASPHRPPLSQEGRGSGREFRGFSRVAGQRSHAQTKVMQVWEARERVMTVIPC